jgi:hypothetical protein
MEEKMDCQYYQGKALGQTQAGEPINIADIHYCRLAPTGFTTRYSPLAGTQVQESAMGYERCLVNLRPYDVCPHRMP